MLKYVILLLLPFCLNLSAKTILISDVDDTIKDSRINDFDEMIKRLPQTGPEVLIPKMNDTYNRLKLEYGVDRYFYVSKLTSILEGYHIKFLNNNNFPEGPLYAHAFKADFKFRKISEILKKELPDEVILIGDNGQEDSNVYRRIELAHVSQPIDFRVFIRTAIPGGAKEVGHISFDDGNDLIAKIIQEKNSNYMFLGDSNIAQ